VPESGIMARLLEDTILTLRRRRTAEESRALILQVAAKRLAEYGLEGLNITGVSQEAGISHATLIHHFGSSGGMREALADKMTLDLVQDLVSSFDGKMSQVDMTQNVFHALSAGGPAKLIAWLAVEGGRESGQSDAVAEGFKKLLLSMKILVEARDEKDLQNLILLVGSAAIGFGLAGNVLAHLLGMDQSELDSFPNWMTEHIT
jgi:AcrR family transcriptional regulator